MNGEFHFDGVSGATFSEDGQYVFLETTGAAGPCTLRLPLADVPRSVATLMTAAEGAQRISQTKIHRAMTILSVKVQDIPGSEEVLLLIGIHTGAPPLALKLTKTQLAEFSHGLLQTLGLAVSGKPGIVQ